MELKRICLKDHYWSLFDPFMYLTVLAEAVWSPDTNLSIISFLVELVVLDFLFFSQMIKFSDKAL